MKLMQVFGGVDVFWLFLWDWMVFLLGFPGVCWIDVCLLGGDFFVGDEGEMRFCWLMCFGCVFGGGLDGIRFGPLIISNYSYPLYPKYTFTILDVQL